FTVDLLCSPGVFYLALRGADAGVLLDKILFLLHRVELDNDVALMYRLTRFGQPDDTRRRHLGSGQNHGTGALDFAACTHADHKIATPHAGHRDFNFRRSGIAPGSEPTTGACQTYRNPNDNPAFAGAATTAQPLFWFEILRHGLPVVLIAPILRSARRAERS